ncbi:MAG: proline-rich domain-containing protein [Spirosomataceae bacterium]
MKKYMIMVGLMMVTVAATKAQYGYSTNGYNDERYYCDDNFDWHWDIRVRISNGVRQGLLTPNETNRLYRRLEDIERREYAYQSDGFFSSWEQQEIWDEIMYLNRQVGLELYDYDRAFYGFDPYGYDRRGYANWYYSGGYDFYRFDKRGFGNVKLGYAPRSNYTGWFRHNNNRAGRDYYNGRNHDYGRNRNDYPGSRGGYDNRPNVYPNQGGGHLQGGYDNRPNTYPNQGGSRPQGGYDTRPNPSGGYDNRPNTYPNQGGSRPQGGYDTRPNPSGGYDNGRNPQSPVNGGNDGRPNPSGGYDNGRNPQVPANGGNDGRRYDPTPNDRGGRGDGGRSPQTPRSGERHRHGEW